MQIMKALNAKDACEKLEVDADELDKMWGGAKKAMEIVREDHFC